VTAQIPDRVVYRSRVHSLVGARGGRLFSLAADAGVTEPVPLSTACWRGYQAAYVVHDGRLILAHVDLGLPTDPETGEALAPLIHGTPCRMTAEGEPTGHYRRIDQPVDFTGNLLIASGFIRELHVHMGFQPPFAYREVFELSFAGGRLVTTRDVSDIIAEVRRALDGPDRPRPDEDLAGWIARRFDLDFGWDLFSGPGE